MVTESPYSDWEESLEQISQGGGTVILVGGTDTGKSSYTRLLANRCLMRGQKVAILDADPGQSEIGPPACLGLAFPQKTFESFSELSPHSLGFWGRTAPSGNLLEYFAQLVRLASQAEERRLIVDMSGYISGAGARQLYHSCFDVLAPSHLVALQRKQELSAIIAPLRASLSCSIYQPPIPPCIAKKPSQFRAMRRMMRFASYFENAESHSFQFDDVGLIGTWLGNGTPVPAHVLKYLNQMVGAERRVYHAEIWGKELGLMMNQNMSLDSPALGHIMQHLKVSSIVITVAPQLKNVLVGMEDGKGKVLGMGILTALDFKRRTFGIQAHLRASGAVKLVRFGALRVQQDGTELGIITS